MSKKSPWSVYLNLYVSNELYATLDELALLWDLSVQGAAKKFIMEGIEKAAEEGLCLPVEHIKRRRGPGGGRKADPKLHDEILSYKNTGLRQVAVAREVGCSQALVSMVWGADK